MGQLVFANKSNKQFVLVNLCGPKESGKFDVVSFDFEALADI